MVDVSTEATPGRGDLRRAAIHDAAIAEFSEHGVARASMARIAERAGVSRPALYQYFANKREIFASAFVDLFEQHVDRALEALRSPGDLADRLDGFLQRFDGDLYEAMAATTHLDEIEGAKAGDLAVRIAAVIDALWAEAAVALADVQRTSGVDAADTLDLLRWAPKGLRGDQPPVDRYRRRLTALATSIAG